MSEDFRSRWKVLRVRPLLWALPLALVLLNVGLFTFYRVAYAGQVEVLQRDRQRESEIYRELRGERERLEAFLGRISSSSAGVNELYLHYFGTEAQRLTQVRSEIKNLARRAGLEPSALRYPRTDLKGIPLLRLGVTFGVEGTYEQLRQLINLLELSDHFLILEQVSLSKNSVIGTQSPKLSINLKLSTIFTSDQLARDTVEQLRPATRSDGLSTAPDRDDPGAPDVEPGKAPDDAAAGLAGDGAEDVEAIDAMDEMMDPGGEKTP